MTNFQRDCKRLRRWFRGTDPKLAEQRERVGHTYSAGMGPGTWDAEQGRRGLAATRKRELAIRKAAAAAGRLNDGE